MIIQLYGKVICALKSPVREIATIEGTSIHQKTDKIYYNHWERERVVCTKKKKKKKRLCLVLFAHVSSVDVGMLNPAGQAHNIGAFVLYKLYMDLLVF